jgi:hypothetical protein
MMWPGSISVRPISMPSAAWSGVTCPPPAAMPNPAAAMPAVSQFGMRRVRMSLTTAVTSPAPSTIIGAS